MEKYTKEYFIEKFEAIPDELWIEIELSDDENPNCHCVLGHCGVSDLDYLTDEANGLIKILEPVHTQINKGNSNDVWDRVTDINDGIFGCRIFGNTPKQRILNALKSLP